VSWGLEGGIKREKEGLLMELSDILNSNAVKTFIKGMLVLIGLFGILS